MEQENGQTTLQVDNHRKGGRPPREEDAAARKPG